jgi:alpha-glucuronidase
MKRLSLCLLVVLCTSTIASAETGYDAWLRYADLDPAAAARYDSLPAAVVTLGDSPVLRSARDEIVRGVRGSLGRTLRVEPEIRESAIVVGTVDELARAIPSFRTEPVGEALREALRGALREDGFVLRRVAANGRAHVVVAGSTERGALYGAFALLRKIATGDALDRLDVRESPYAPIRLVNHWDNLDGTIERGYAGPSIFFANDTVREDLTRVRDYARMLASVGINGCSINNVNADSRVVADAFLPQLARVADAFRPWGVRVYVSIDFSGPKRSGDLDTFDPLDPRVVAWWKARVDAIYAAVPDFGGFVLKADSEGRLGPSAYGRTHADAANAIARALAPHGGLIFYRGFVYDHHMDWRELKNDRALAAYDNFKPLDGKFDPNVVVQIKHGPIDFQVREPASPLFGALERTNEAIELQITQEYTGQQRQLVFLAPMWKEVLDVDMAAKPGGTTVAEIVAGKSFSRPTGGFVGVSNVGMSENWLAHDLAAANLYAFGRLAWDPSLSSRKIAEEWTRLTFGNDPKVVSTISSILLDSWPIYEKYTGPLGAGTLTDIIHVHYGPAPESSEYNGWGQWHRADAKGVGMDRTVATGTGFAAQYRPPLARRFESVATTPEELLLFFHHVPYTHVLKSGKSVIQHIYDSHYEGAEEARGLVERWRTLEGLVDEPRYRAVLARLEYQADYAIVWRDSIAAWFHKKSGIEDARRRVGHYPDRVEAEAMKADGYKKVDVTPWEAASGAAAVACEGERCAASFVYDGEPGWRDLSVQYFDQNQGASRYRLSVAGQVVAEWTADDDLPSDKIDAHTSTRHTTRRVALRPGDEIRVEAVRAAPEAAAIDYVEVRPSS